MSSTTHWSAAAFAVCFCIAVASPSLADRGIDAPHIEKPPMTCSEVLRSGRHLRVTFRDGRELVGKVVSADAEGLGLRPRGSDEVTRIDKEQVASLRARGRRFPRLSTLGGVAFGMIGGLIYATATDERSDDDWDVLYRLGMTVVGGGVGLVLGTALPIIHPGEKEIDCAW